MKLSINKKRILLVLGIIISFSLVNTLKIPCYFRKVTGLYCPGCGITRSIKSLLKLDIYSSLHNNIFIVLIVFFIIKLFINGKIIVNKKVEYIIIFLLILYGIMRNIDTPIFNFLRPI